MSSAGEWCLIESDPGVFSELMRGFGVEGVQVEEIYDISAESFEELKPILGLIFLFKWQPDPEPDSALTIVNDNRLERIFFAKQVISNACATQALLHVILNCEHPDLRLGSNLTEFKEFSKCFDSSLKGLALSNAETIRSVHNSFGQQQVVFVDGPSSHDRDAYHFVSFVPIDGRLYELDGLRSGPIDHGKITEGVNSWMERARAVLIDRIRRHQSSVGAESIEFALMAVVTDRRSVLLKQREAIKEKYQHALVNAQAPMLSSGNVMASPSADGDPFLMQQNVYGNASAVSGNSAAVDELAACLAHLDQRILGEDQKRQRQRAENIRRRHNYIPFIVELLKLLASQGKLVPLLEQAKRRAADRAAPAGRPIRD